jgi:hypothetical protein
MGKLKNLFTSGRMNKDFDERLVPKGEYRDALNVKVSNSNGSDVGAVENALSNEALSSVSFGANATCIGSVADDKNRKIYWFVKSDSGSYIMEYSKDNGDVNFVLTDTRVGANSVLNFSKAYLITGVNILIDQDNDKVFIYWTDGLNPPRKIDVSESKLLGVNAFTDSDISVIKSPPRKEPTISGILYDEDSIEPNLISDKFFCFSYRYKYSDNQFSAISPFSGFAFKPGETDIDFLDTTTDSMRNKFSAVSISVNTGGKDVIGIEVLARESNGANLFLVKKINKEKESVQNNIDYSFIFKNNGVYSVLSEDEFNRSYDNVPLSAFSQDFIGNRLVYGNYIENYDIKDNLGNDINFDIISNVVSEELELSCPTSTSYTIRKVGAGADLSFKRCGEAQWTVLDIEQGEYVEVCASELSNISTDTNTYSVTDNGPCEAYIGKPTMKSNRTYEIGVVYFDSYGRKSPVLTSSSSSVFVPHFNASKSNKIKSSINFKAPVWADRYKFAVKQVDSDFDVIRTRGPLYKVKEGSIRYVYISLPQLELSKIVEGGLLVLKNNGVEFNNSTTNQFRVISVETYEAGWNDNSGEAGTYVKLQGPAELFEDNSSLVVPTTSKDIIFETFSVTEEAVPYYEIPGTYDVVNGFHTGNIQNQTANQPAEVLLDVHNAYSFGNGVESIKIDDDKNKASISIGVRANEVFDDYRQNIRSSSLTYGGVYDQTTNYNALNEFNLSLANYKDMDDQYGSIQKIHSRDSDLIVFQENKIHKILFNKSVLFNADGTGNVSQTISVLGQEVPFKGEYGISFSPESFQSWGYKMYFADERRGAICRLTENGIFEISDYGMHDWFRDNLSDSVERSTVGGYDPINDQYIISLKDGFVEWKEDEYSCEGGLTEWLEDTYTCQQESDPTTTTTTAATTTTSSTTTTTSTTEPTTTTSSTTTTTSTTEPASTTTTTTSGGPTTTTTTVATTTSTTIPTTPPPTTIAPSYYSLERCSDGAIGFRTQQEVQEISLSVNDRVEGSGPTIYIVTGTTTSGTNIGLVSDTGLTGCPPPVTTTTTLGYNYYYAQPCSGGTTVTMRSVTTFSNGESFKFAGDSTCYEVIASGAPANNNDWSEAFPDCSACLPTPTTTTTTVATTTTSVPNKSWIAERFDGLVYAYVWLQQGYQINDLVTLNDGSGQCWTLGDQTTADGQYNITGTCPPPTTQPPTTTSTTIVTTTTKAPAPTTTTTTSAPTTQPPATTTTQPITTQAPTTTTVAPTTAAATTTSTTAAPTTTTTSTTTPPATTTTQAPITTTTAAPTTVAPTTTTTTIVTYAGARTSGQSTSDDACNLFAFDNVWFATPTPEDGARVYTDSTAQTPFNGGDQWYGIDMDGNGVAFSTRITSFGYMYSTTECLGGGGFP